MDNSDLSELYMDILKTIPDPFFIVSENGTYLEVLGGIERTLYDDATSLKGRNIYEFSEKSFADFFMDQVRKTLDTGILNCFEYQLETRKVDLPKNGPGGMQWFEARLYPLANHYQGQLAVTAMVINISERKLMQQRLRDLSYMDPLTSVANRRFFLEHLSEELESSLTDKTTVSVMILDIDHFKQINDTYGHLVGDHVLKDLVTIAKTILRKRDIIARFGGDEFIISMVGVEMAAVLQIAEQLRERVRQYDFRPEDIQIKVTISIGVSNATLYDTDISSIISRADKALYQAKELGRDQVRRG
jgi:diguanylate cyclase (GGDEF)-like protein/PAS domain S-box-containing protein